MLLTTHVRWTDGDNEKTLQHLSIYLRFFNWNVYMIKWTCSSAGHDIKIQWTLNYIHNINIMFLVAWRYTHVCSSLKYTVQTQAEHKQWIYTIVNLTSTHACPQMNTRQLLRGNTRIHCLKTSNIWHSTVV